MAWGSRPDVRLRSGIAGLGRRLGRGARARRRPVTVRRGGRRLRPPRLTGAGRVLVALGATLLALSATLAAVALAAPATDDRVGLMVGYLQRAQNLDGGWGGRPGEPSDPMFTAWVAIALGAGSVNPQDQALPGGTDAYTYLTRHAGDLSVTTDYERAAMVATAAGTSLRDFGGVDLMQAILARQNPDGGFPHGTHGDNGVNDTIFAIIALAQVGEPAVQAAVQRAADWVIRAQRPDGGWPAVALGGETDFDMTGAAIQALNAAGRRDTDAQQRALALLRSIQGADGGFRAVQGDPESNTASTCWIVQGLWSAGVDPRSWKVGEADPLSYLASMQQPDGSIRWKTSRDLNPLWMTSYCAPAYAGRPNPPVAVARRLPVSEPPPADTPAPPPAPDPAAGGAPGEGGDGPGGGGALTGGDGSRAPLFTAPQPQSKGRTAGGVRRVKSAEAHRAQTRRSRDHSIAQQRDAARLRDGGSRRQRERARAEAERERGVTEAPADEAPAPIAPGAPSADSAAGPDAAGAVATEDAAARAGGASGSDPLATGAGGGGDGSDPNVTGTVIGGDEQLADAGPGDDGAPVAPGIRGARAGGDPEPAVALGLAGALLLAAGFGTQLERRREPEEIA